MDWFKKHINSIMTWIVIVGGLFWMVGRLERIEYSTFSETNKVYYELLNQNSSSIDDHFRVIDKLREIDKTLTEHVYKTEPYLAWLSTELARLNSIIEKEHS